MIKTLYGDLSEQELRQLNELLSRTTMRSVGYGQPPQAVAEQAPAPAPAPQNYIKFNSRGKVVSLDAAAQPRHDVWANGERTLSRRQLSDGTFEVTKRVPAYDGDRRQSSATVRQIEVPDYLNPVKQKEVQYRKQLADAKNAEAGGRGQGTWMNLESNGKMYQVHSLTGQVRPLMLEGAQLEGKGMAQINRNKAVAEATKTYANQMAQDLEQGLADILQVPREDLGKYLGAAGDVGAAQKAVSPAVGIFDANTPTLRQNPRNIRSAIENLRSKAQMFGLTNLRQSGVAPGSITEKEWPKFESTLANIDPTLGEDAFIKQLVDIYRKTQAARNAGHLDYTALTGAAPTNEPSQIPAAAIQYLQANDSPAIRQQFDEMFGPGASLQYIGGQ